MDKTVPEALKTFEKIDPELLKLIVDTREFAMSDGAMPAKFKLLIVMALDAAHGKVEGTRELAQQAMEAEATKEQVAEALRVTQYVCGVQSMFTAGRGLRDMF
jgi:alkylhydroperoxidase/carboxymuconolactone decarboxylase family protein YurZ